MRRKKNPPDLHGIKKETLVVIGNGFDIWQGLDTGYASFQAYYLAHRDEVLKKLHIKKHTVRDSDGDAYQITDVELIYGDPFDPAELDDTFWGTFETSLSNVDAERVNFFFGRGKSDLRAMKRSVKNASRILKETFCGWIASVVIDRREPSHNFGEGCLFINFNYTDTLLKRFQIDSKDEFHIHGEAADKKSIIFGHSDHPQQPTEELAIFGGRFRGLYLLEELLYATDKHVHENIFTLAAFLAMHGAASEDIREVYVLGHSMSPPDLEYFAFLMDATRTHDPTEARVEPATSEASDPMAELQARIEYAIERYGYQHGSEHIDPSQKLAMARRLEMERDANQKLMEREFFRAMGKRRSRRRTKSEALPPASRLRTEDAVWRLSYHGASDKAWKERVLQELGCKRYELFPTIDDCLEKYRICPDRENA